VLVNAPVAGSVRPAAEALPLGRGSSLSAFTATINTINTAFLTSTSAFVSAPGSPGADQQGGGVWARTVGGGVDTKTSSTGVLDGIITDPGRQTCHTSLHQDYVGYQVGHDISVLNAGGTGTNLHFGITAGGLTAWTKDTTPGGAFSNNVASFTTAPGSFKEKSEVPFVGLYTAATKGNLFFDSLLRWDFYQNSLSDVNNGLFDQRLDARGISLTANLGYHIPLPNSWFIEPSGGVVASRVSVDPLNVAGLLTQNPAPPNFAYSRGTVAVDDIDSVLGRASVSVGTSIKSGQVTWQPYFTASVYHEFSGNVTVRSVEAATGNPGLDGVTLTQTSTGGLGTYGQFSLGTAAVLANTGWLGYGRVDYKIGDDIEGWSVTAGLRYQFDPAPAAGSLKDGPAPIVYSYNWTGPYIGAFAGATWGSVAGHFTPPDPPTGFGPDFAGYLLGGQAGYNVQSGHWVVGIEGDYGTSNAHGGVSCPSAFFFTCEGEVHDLASLTGRLGVTWGRALFYAKGGLATGEVEATGARNTGSPTVIGILPVALVQPVPTTKWQLGWTVGGGMEFALTNRWSAKAEYMHYDLGSDRYQVSNGPEFVDAATTGDTVRIGLNYHFQREAPAPLK
jgi:opacity protein-like surface antigen